MFKFTHTEDLNDRGSTITREYTGFTAKFTPINHKDNLVVIAWWDGEPDFWVVDPNAEGVEQLQEYYNDMIGEVPPFTFLKETK